jgi:hypothetical protein
VWAGIDELSRRIASFGDAAFGREVRENVSQHLERFADAYEDFVKHYSSQTTFTLTSAARDLHIALRSVQLVGHLAAEAFEQSPRAVDDGATIEFVFSTTPSPEELAQKLAALAAIYSKLAELLSVSTAAEPLRIMRLESGSWWIKLLGSIPVISVMAAVAKAGAGYFYRNFTREGRLSELPRRVELLDQFLELRSKLEGQGLNTAELTENIDKATVVLAMELNTLLSGDAGVIIDREEFGGANRWLAQNALPNSLRPSLGSGSDDQLSV